MQKSFFLFVVFVLIVVSIRDLSKKIETPREEEVEMAILRVFFVKVMHHNKIMIALEDGATDADHTDLLEDKRIDVLAKMEEVELEFNVVFDKTDPAKKGMPIVLSQ